MTDIIQQLLDPEHQTIQVDREQSLNYAIYRNYFEIGFSKPLVPPPDKDTFLSVYIGDRLVFAGVVESSSMYHLKLVSPIEKIYRGY